MSVQELTYPQPIVKSHEARVVLTALADNEMTKILGSARGRTAPALNIGITNLKRIVHFESAKYF